jgi:hypothetical protein
MNIFHSVLYIRESRTSMSLSSPSQNLYFIQKVRREGRKALWISSRGQIAEQFFLLSYPREAMVYGCSRKCLNFIICWYVDLEACMSVETGEYLDQIMLIILYFILFLNENISSKLGAWKLFPTQIEDWKSAGLKEISLNPFSIKLKVLKNAKLKATAE